MTAQGMEARRAETGTGSVHDSPVREADAPETACLCGARQPTPHPIKCWNCKEDTMGKYQEKTR
jgi:hypothetical protein